MTDEKIRNKAMELLSRAARDASEANVYMAAGPDHAVCCFEGSTAEKYLERAVKALQDVREFLKAAREKGESEEELKKFLAL